MRPFLLLPLAISLPCLAQDAPKAAAPDANFAPPPEEKSLSGRVEATLGGATSRATFAFEAPGTLRLAFEPDAAAGSQAREVEASGAQTLIAEGKRRRRAGFNGLAQWFRSANEPLAQALGPWLSPTRELAAPYTLATSRDGEATIVEARASGPGKYLRRDQVRSGGAGGQRFYAARTVEAWDRPAKMRLRVESGRIVRREDFTLATATRPSQVWTWRYENGRPTLIEARDSRDAVRARWKISFDAEPAARPALAAPQDAIIEGDAPAGDQAAALLAKGVAEARAERYSAAVASFRAAAALKPRAVAAPLAEFEAALAVRNVALARAALLKITALEGEGSLRAATSRARLALQEGSGAEEALAQVLEAAPASPARLQVADLMRSSGQRDQAVQLLLPLVNAEAGAVPDGISAQAAARLYEWFSPLEQPARDAVAAKITAASTCAQVARALLKDGGEAPDASKSPALEALLARKAALEGRDDEATRLWASVAKGADEELWLRAQLSMVQVAARRKDAAGAVAANRAAWPFLSGESAREAWLYAATQPWVKASQQKPLRAALRESSLRGVGRAAPDVLEAAEADARLLLSLDEGQAEGVDTLRAQAARWKGAAVRGAWWQGRLGEVLASVATDTPLEQGSARKRDSIFDEALRAVDAAIEADPSQPFYREQKLLVASGRVSGARAVSDAASGVRGRENSQAALTALRASYPQNPDALLSAGLALLTTQQEKAAVPLLQQSLALLDAQATEAQDASSERVARVTALSSLAGALRKAGDNDGAAKLYAQLFESARSPLEQGVFASNWLNALYEAREPAGAAAILTQVARSNWKPSQTQDVLAQVLAGVSARPPWKAAVRQALEGALRAPDAASPGLAEGATLIAAYLDFSALNSARRAALPTAPAAGNANPAPPASPQAQQALDAAVAVWRADVARLEKLASSKDAGIAGQALSLLAQDALLRTKDDEAAAFFERALERVPADEGLALPLATTLASKGAPTAAEPQSLRASAEDAPRILKARNALLLRLPHDTALLQIAAQMSEQASRAQDAQKLRARARALAFFDESASPADYDSLDPQAPPQP